MDLPKLRDFLDAFDVPWPVAGGVALGSGAIVYLHDQGFRYLKGLPDWAEALLTILSVYGIVVIGMKCIRWLAEANARRRHRNKRLKAINELLDALSAEEREVFRFLVTNNQQSFTTSLTDANTATLIQKRLVVRGSGTHSRLEWPHTVPADVWIELQLRKQEFE